MAGCCIKNDPRGNWAIIMGAEEVVEKILADARGEAGKIKKEAEEKQAAEQGKLDEQLAEYSKQTDIMAQQEAKEEKLHLLAAARMEVAKELLAEKRRILGEVFAKAREKLLSLPDEEYRKIMGKLMLKAVETGEEEVIVDKNEKRINQEFIGQINQQLGAGRKGNLRLSEKSENIGAGFILRRGKIKNNASVEVLLAQASEELETELAKELFGN